MHIVGSKKKKMIFHIWISVCHVGHVAMGDLLPVSSVLDLPTCGNYPCRPPQTSRDLPRTAVLFIEVQQLNLENLRIPLIIFDPNQNVTNLINGCSMTFPNIAVWGWHWSATSSRVLGLPQLLHRAAVVFQVSADWAGGGVHLPLAGAA